MTKFFKMFKKPYFGGYFEQFLPKFGEKWIFLEKKGFVSFYILIIYYGAKNLKKIWKIRQTENCDFIGPSVGQGLKNQIWNRMRLSLRGKNNRKLNLFIKTMVHRSNIHYSRINQKGNWRKHIQFLLELQKMRPPKHLVLFSIWKRG